MKKQNEMEILVDEMMEHICDKLCRHPRQIVDPEQLVDVCVECRMGEFLNAYNREVTKRRWIPVDERLPKEDTEVIVTVDGGDEIDTFASSDVCVAKDWQNWNGVIAWMPLPEPFVPQN